jgi:ABC-type uncharacterized transport system substrate-binding protein
MTPKAKAICLMIGAAVTLGLRDDRAAAHPHLWIDAVTTFVFEDHALVGLRHQWRFDELFSAFVIEEHDGDGDGAFDAAETQAVRAQAFANLREYDYFTHLRIGGKKLPLDEVSDFAAENDDGALVYSFTMPLPDPVVPGAEPVAVGIYDPEYYVEILLDEFDPVRFEGISSGACTFSVREDTEHPIYYGVVNPLVIALSCATS